MGVGVIAVAVMVLKNLRPLFHYSSFPIPARLNDGRYQVCRKAKNASTGCYVDVKSPNTRMLFFLMTLLLSRPKRDLLLYVARHMTVTLT